ncbi:MAG: RNA ligase partner protein [Patescibacteria group bacterium]
MEQYILDTNLFFNMEPGLNMGKNTKEVLENITKAARIMKNQKKGEIYMPPRIVDEFLGFFDSQSLPTAKTFLEYVNIKSPIITNIQFPASTFYNIIDDIRQRSYRGLTIAEEELVGAVKNKTIPDPNNKKEFEIAVGKHTANLRARYRNATRTGFLDSLADLDVIVLAKELDGFLVSADEGVIEWGRKFGVHEIEAQVFGKKLLAFVREEQVS